MKLCTVPACKAKDVYLNKRLSSRQGFLKNRFKPPVESSDLIVWSQPRSAWSPTQAVVPPMMSEKINRPTVIGMMTT